MAIMVIIARSFREALPLEAVPARGVLRRKLIKVYYDTLGVPSSVYLYKIIIIIVLIVNLSVLLYG